MRDSDLIDALGGSSKLAERLGYDKAGGVQRVQNWKVRGIPARIKLQRPDLFLSDLNGAAHELRASAEPTPGPSHAG